MPLQIPMYADKTLNTWILVVCSVHGKLFVHRFQTSFLSCVEAKTRL